MNSIALDLSKESGGLNLGKVAPSLSVVKGVLNWDPHPSFKNDLSKGFDLDIMAFAVQPSGKIAAHQQDLCWYRNQRLYGGAVEIPVDNRTGEGADDETVIVNLPELVKHRSRLDLWVFLYDAAQRSQHFGMMQNAHFKLFDNVTGGLIQSYVLSSHANNSCLHLGCLNHQSGDWVFEPVGESGVLDLNGVLKLYS